MSQEAASGDRDSSGVRIPPPLFFLAGLLVGYGLEQLLPIDGAPDAFRVAACVIGVALWLVLDGTAMFRFRRAGTSMIPFNPTTALVTSGPYRITRNPMYLGMAFLYVGLAVGFDLIWALIVLPVVLAAVDQLVIALEEGYLVRKFGQPYCDYMARVRRWL
jgi:protein-S-isoprenylcysteine O-methyltransferase Ste14